MSVTNDCATTVSDMSDISSSVWSSDTSGDKAIAPPWKIADGNLNCENSGDVRQCSGGESYESRPHPPKSHCGDVGEELQGLLVTAADANVKLEDDMQELEQKLTAEMLRVNTRMVEMSQFKKICDEEIERRKLLEVELQEHKKDLEELHTRVQTKEAQLQEVSRKLNETVADRDSWKAAYVQNEKTLMDKARRQEEALLQTLQSTKDKYNQEIMALRERTDEVEEKLRDHNRRQAADEFKKRHLQAEVLKLRALVKRLHDYRSKSREQFESRVSKLVKEADEERASLDHEVAQLRDRCEASVKINEVLRSELVETRKALITCQEQKSEAEQSLRRLTTQLQIQMADSHIKYDNILHLQKYYSDLEEEKKIKEGQLDVLRDDLKASEKCRLELNAELREARRQIEMLNSEDAQRPSHLPRSEAQVDNFLEGQRTSR
ncbi:unnamed protein product [Schistocephalus solidus]|uniref:Cilia- and flagella-associated protein 157 n=1 Tax=Schistocephalus solidus TaxID=70667 RepID=A0A183TB97_SCHSO|nr:unnamed protein product [Schistocephalus solidus]